MSAENIQALADLEAGENEQRVLAFLQKIVGTPNGELDRIERPSMFRVFDDTRAALLVPVEARSFDHASGVLTQILHKNVQGVDSFPVGIQIRIQMAPIPEIALVVVNALTGKPVRQVMYRFSEHGPAVEQRAIYFLKMIAGATGVYTLYNVFSDPTVQDSIAQISYELYNDEGQITELTSINSHVGASTKETSRCIKNFIAAIQVRLAMEKDSPDFKNRLLAAYHEKADAAPPGPPAQPMSGLGI